MTPPIQREDGRPERLDAEALVRHVLEESAHYRLGAIHDDRYGLELLRRAIVEQDDGCWALFVGMCEGLVSFWCRRAGAGDELDDALNRAWERFWRNFTPAKLAEAGSMGAVLRYLQLCVCSAVIDGRRRAGAAWHADALVEGGRTMGTSSPADLVEVEEDRHTFWRLVSHHLLSEQERVLVRLKYVLDLRPAEIAAARPDLFDCVDEVYRVRRNVINRLRHSSALRRWRAEAHASFDLALRSA